MQEKGRHLVVLFKGPVMNLHHAAAPLVTMPFQLLPCSRPCPILFIHIIYTWPMLPLKAPHSNTGAALSPLLKPYAISKTARPETGLGETEMPRAKFLTHCYRAGFFRLNMVGFGYHAGKLCPFDITQSLDTRNPVLDPS